jgi:hypothetical protein
VSNESNLEQSRPPRRVALPVRIRVLFAGLAQFGWFFLGFGLIFVWIIVPAADLRAPLDFRGTPERTEGRITSTVETGFRTGSSSTRRGRAIYANHYAFTADATEHEGASYSGTELPVGQTVTVEYPAGAPERSRIMGMRRSPFGAWAALVVLFPLIGLVIIGPTLRKGLRRIDLLRRGLVGRAVLESKVATNVEINDRTVFALGYLFEDEGGGVHRFTTKSHDPERLEDDVDELVLYDPLRPERALLVDELLDRVTVDEHGGIGGVGAGRAVASLAVPAATVVGHGMALAVKLL